MANWCSNAIAFYQDGGGNYLLEAFYVDIWKYQDCKDPETGNLSSWVGHWLQSNRVNPETMYTRGFITSIELYSDHVRVEMETAWEPLPEVWDIMADKYGLSYVYIAEELGLEIYVNTDAEERFFSDRYVIQSFEVDDLGLDVETMILYGERLRELGEFTRYYDSFEDVLRDFTEFSFDVATLDKLNNRLDEFGIEVYEYSVE